MDRWCSQACFVAGQQAHRRSCVIRAFKYYCASCGRQSEQRLHVCAACHEHRKLLFRLFRTDPERQMRGFLVEPLAPTAYCDHACQTQHWLSHRHFCFGPNRGLGAGFGAASTAAPQSDVTSLHAFDEIEEDLLDDVDLDNVPEPETAPEWSGDSDGSEGGEGFDGGTGEVEQAAESTPSVAAEPVESMDTIDTVELSPGASSSQREH